MDYQSETFYYERCPYSKDGRHTLAELNLVLGGGFSPNCGECGSVLTMDYFRIPIPPKRVPSPSEKPVAPLVYLEEPTEQVVPSHGCCFGI